LETTVGGALFRTGATRIENAWFADPSRLRLMLGGPVSDASAKGWSMRAYQADAAGPGELEAAGQGVQLPASGPVFHDVELVHPLMPLLLELTDAEGVIRDIALLPFPSLLPGGIHGAELKALQNEPNPMDAFWSLSETLLQEAIGRPDWPSRSITELAVGGSGMLPEALRNWLAALFGLSVSQASATPVSGMRLVLPPGAVPSISALVSRGLDPGEGRQATGPFLVVDEGTLRPRWSVTLPSDTACEAELPFIQRDGHPSRGKQKPKPLPVHLAIVARPEAPAVVPRSADTEAAALRQEPLPLTVVLHSSDPERTRAQRGALTQFGRDALELIAAAPDTDLRDVAASARHDMILTLSDGVHFDGEALHALAGLIRKDEQTASASCVLLAETMFKKQTVLRPATGGLFPSRVSFAASPRLGFVEPDVLQALSGLTYPVVANTFQFTLWRRAALAELPRPSGPVPRSAADIRVGLDLIEAGYRNLCTCTVAVRLAGAYARRDEIDPVGAAYLQPARWEDLLGRVTVLRELF
jgi:hypothetical protein